MFRVRTNKWKRTTQRKTNEEGDNLENGSDLGDVDNDHVDKDNDDQE